MITRKWAGTARYLSKTTITKPPTLQPSNPPTLESETVVTPSPLTLTVFVSVAWLSHSPGDDEMENYHGYQVNDCWGQWYEAPYWAVSSEQYSSDKVSPQYIHSSFVSLNRQLGGILTCNLNITISSNHIWISAPLIEPVDTWNKQSVTLGVVVTCNLYLVTTLYISFQLGFIFSASALISLVMTVLVC